jgi:regulator of sirC expression with transglutaminase-like and TPR domain
MKLVPEDAGSVYNKACCYSLQGDANSAIQCLQAAIALAPQSRDMAKTDTDFDPIRHDERFRALVEGG